MNTSSTKKRGLWAIMSPIKYEVIASMMLSAFGVMSLVISLVILSFTLSAMIEGKPLMFFEHTLELFNVVILIAVFTVMGFLSRLYAFIVSHFGAFRLEEILRTRLSSHLAKIPLGYIISNGSGALKKVMLNDVKNLHTFVADSVPMIAKSIFAPITCLVVLFYIDYKFALASVSVLIIGAAIMSIAMRDSMHLRKQYEQSQEDINKSVIEFVQAMPVVRTFDDGSSSFKRYNDALHRYKKTLKEWMNTSGNSARIAMLTLSPLPTLIVVLFCGLFFLNEQTTTLSAFIAALFLSTGMADALMPVMWLTNFIKKSQSAAFSIQDILEVQPLQQSQQIQVPKDATIEFKNVTFQYDNVNQEALKNISFTVPQGSVTALVGPSGAGKSTIAKLIPRFWDVTSGSIHIGGVNIKEIESQILMDTVSFVFQDTFLFQDTLFNNIKMANGNALDEEVYEAARAAQIHDFILSLPQGYDTKAGDRGANLSGGQKQRITIARAILRDAPIVVLDEATAFADPQNEEAIIKALANLMEHKTVIVIAHRLSTIKDVDQIMVFDEGKIVQKGKHEQLLQTQGVYHNLWENYLKAQSWDLHKQEHNNEQE